MLAQPGRYSACWIWKLHPIEYFLILERPTSRIRSVSDCSSYRISALSKAVYLNHASPEYLEVVMIVPSSAVRLTALTASSATRTAVAAPTCCQQLVLPYYERANYLNSASLDHVPQAVNFNDHDSPQNHPNQIERRFLNIPRAM